MSSVDEVFVMVNENVVEGSCADEIVEFVKDVYAWTKEKVDEEGEQCK